MGGIRTVGRTAPYVSGPRFPVNSQPKGLNPRLETEIMYLNMLGADMVVLNSSEVIADLLDKRSAIYSDKVMSSVPFVQSESNVVAFHTIAPITDSGTNGYR